MSFLREFVRFVFARKKYWLVPVLEGAVKVEKRVTSWPTTGLPLTQAGPGTKFAA